MLLHRDRLLILPFLILLLFLTACAPVTQAESEGQNDLALRTAPRNDVRPVDNAPVVIPTLTPLPPTSTSIPTVTVAPTNTPAPTLTPTITNTPGPSSTPTMTLAQERQQDQFATATAIANLAANYAASYSDINALPVQVVFDMPHEYQRLNNCAPTTTSMMLRYYGLNLRQADMAALQKPVSSDVNVTSEEVAASIREVGLNAYVGYNGDIDIVIKLLAAGFPVMTEEWMAYDGGVGHFRANHGYDRDKQQILYNDSFLGANKWRSYNSLLTDWAPNNNKFIVVYRNDEEMLLRALIGPDWDEMTDYATLRDVSNQQIQANRYDAYAWWGLGEASLRLGDPESAVAAFEQSVAIGLPQRYLWYRYGNLEAYNATGRYDEALITTNSLLKEMKHSEDVRYHRAIALYAVGRVDDAITQLTLALQENPRFIPAQVLLTQYGG